MVEKVSGRHKFLFWVGFFALGVAFDFIFVGVLKIIWILIYGITYLTIATTIDSQMRHKYHKRLSRVSALCFLLGAFLGHFSFTGWHREDVYLMKLESSDPIVLKATEFPEFLYLTSTGLKKEIVDKQLATD